MESAKVAGMKVNRKQQAKFMPAVRGVKIPTPKVKSAAEVELFEMSSSGHYVSR